MALYRHRPDRPRQHTLWPSVTLHFPYCFSQIPSQNHPEEPSTSLTTHTDASLWSAAQPPRTRPLTSPWRPAFILRDGRHWPQGAQALCHSLCSFPRGQPSSAPPGGAQPSQAGRLPSNSPPSLLTPVYHPAATLSSHPQDRVQAHPRLGRLWGAQAGCPFQGAQPGSRLHGLPALLGSGDCMKEPGVALAGAARDRWAGEPPPHSAGHQPATAPPGGCLPLTSGARRSCPSRSRLARDPARRAGSKTRCPGTTAAQGSATPAAGGDCSGCGGKRRREPGLAYSQEKPLLSTQRPAKSCSPEAASGTSRPPPQEDTGSISAQRPASRDSGVWAGFPPPPKSSVLIP